MGWFPCAEMPWTEGLSQLRKKTLRAMVMGMKEFSSGSGTAWSQTRGDVWTQSVHAVGFVGGCNVLGKEDLNFSTRTRSRL